MSARTAFLTPSFWIGLALAAVSLHAQGGPPGGTISDFHVVDGATRWVYAATATGVYRSRDDGATWQTFNDGLPVTELTVLSVSGVNNQLFAALNGGGVWRWRNEGPWVQASSGLTDLETYVVAAKPGDPQFVLAGTRSQGVFRSTDGGDSWSKLTSLPTLGSFTALGFAPNDTQRILAMSNPAQVFESRDGGQSWNARAGSQGVTLTGLAFDPSNPDVVYFSSSIGLFKQSGPGQTLAGLPATQNFSFSDVAVDPANSNVLYAADAYGAFVSTDQGGTYTRAVGLPQAGGFKLLALPGETPRVLAGARGTGVFASEDQGATYKLSSIGLNGADVLSLAVDPANAGVVYASVDGGGVFKTTNGGDSWREARQGLPQFRPRRLRIDPTDPNRIYSGSVSPFSNFDGSLARSDDGGATWTSLLSGAPALALEVDPTDGETVWFGSSAGPFGSQASLFRARNRGEDAEAVLAGLNVRGIAVDPTNGSKLYVITEFSGVYELLRSTNKGTDFLIGQQTTIRMVTVAVDPTSPQRVFLGTDTGVFRSTDSGVGFSPVNTGLPDSGAVLVLSIAIDPSNGALYIATSAGVFKSTDSGSSWAAAGTGLEDVFAQEIAVDPHHAGTLYAATFDAGVYKSVDSGATWAPTGTTAAVISRESVVGAFDFIGGGVAPGELVSIFGQGIGPGEGVAVSSFDPATGKLPTELAGVRVFFNDIPAPLLFVRRDQVNVQAPFEIAGLSPARVNIRVEFDGIVSNTVQVAVLSEHPGLFPTPVNLDGSLNGEQSRSAAGAFVLLYATGQGVTNPPVATGATPPTMEPFARPVGLVEVRIGGMNARLFFAGLVAPYVGLMQMNVEIPPGLAPGEYEVELLIDGVRAGARGKIWVGP